MKFVHKEANPTPIVDTVFKIVELAKKAKEQYGSENVVDATIGSLADEQGNLVALQTVFETYNNIEPKIKAAYANSFVGNPNYRKQVAHWLFNDIKLDIAHSVIATPGGTGAVSTTLHCCLSKGETALFPEIAWGSYKLMAQEYGFETLTYQLFEEDHFNLTDFKLKCQQVMDKQNKLVVIINDPCHNPTGYSLTQEEWTQVIQILNDCSKQGPVILLNDIAYIDYSYCLETTHKYMETFNEVSDNVAVVIAFSCSKTLTSYGLRVGAAVILAKHPIDVKEIEMIFEKHARATWSNIANAGMENFVRVTTTGYKEFMREKDSYIQLLKQRSDIFVEEAKACNLPIYPYKEGFFVTLQMPNNEVREKYHQALMQNNIFTVQVNKGIRVAVCSISVEKVKGLAKRLKEVYDSLD